MWLYKENPGGCEVGGDGGVILEDLVRKTTWAT